MGSWLQVNKRYFLLAVFLFVVEVLIARFVHDQIVRPYVGDFLVVILIYCFIKAFLNVSVEKTALFTLLFSYAIEILQYYQFVYRIGLGGSKIARIVIGTSFEWVDLIAYTLGVAFILFVEKVIVSQYVQKQSNT